VKRVYAVEKHCINCHLCEVHCVAAHSRSKDLVRALKDPNKPRARILVEESSPVSIAIQCRHCENPMCVAGCISGAMSKNPDTGAVEYDESRCVGCWTCIAACPFGAVARDSKDGKKVVSKCDLCAARGEPACVANCPNRALVFEEREDDRA
jgi:anaerobic carbon-monoxide dehydrogenase iron sulfur subunit